MFWDSVISLSHSPTFCWNFLGPSRQLSSLALTSGIASELGGGMGVGIGGGSVMPPTGTRARLPFSWWHQIFPSWLGAHPLKEGSLNCLSVTYCLSVVAVINNFKHTGLQQQPSSALQLKFNKVSWLGCLCWFQKGPLAYWQGLVPSGNSGGAFSSTFLRLVDTFGIFHSSLLAQSEPRPVLALKGFL